MNTTETDASFDWIKSLRLAANDFLEVLVDRFTIRKHDGDCGFSLGVEFGADSDAIWHRRGKDEVRERLMSDYRRQRVAHAESLEKFFFGVTQSKRFEFEDAGFPFRFCSGGALPIITIKALPGLWGDFLLGRAGSG
jgi:hypothetical protein